MRKRIDNSKYHRTMRIDPFPPKSGDKSGYVREYVSVFQDISIETLKWKPATVEWSSIGPVSQGDAVKFAVAIGYATVIAGRWTSERAGKSVTPAPSGAQESGE